jgi:hypothetical protein
MNESTILILAADDAIGDLLCRYVELAGRTPVFPRADEGYAEAISRHRPAALLLDASLGLGALPAERAAAGARVPVVYVGSALSDGELHVHATERGANAAPLSGGARKLATTLHELLDERDDTARATPSYADVHPAMLEAAAVIAHSRELGAATAAARSATRELRAEREIALAMCRDDRAALRDAVGAFARELRRAGVPAERALTMMRGVVLNALDAAGSSRDARATLDAAERCWRDIYAS